MRVLTPSSLPALAIVTACLAIVGAQTPSSGARGQTPSSGPRTQTPSSSERPWTPPRTEWGDPDLQGTYNYATLTPVDRPANFANKAVLTEEEAAAYEQQYIQRQASNTTVTAGTDWWDPGTGHLVNRRTSLVVDPPNGRVPPLTAQAQASSRRGRGATTTDGPEDLGLNVRCLQYPTAGPPMLPGMYNVDVQLVQTKQYIVILNEMIHDARIVPMDGRPHGTIPRWMGDPRGHWEGATLVIDTVNLKVPFRGSDEHLHLIERFTRTDADTIEYRFTVEDSTIWTQPWTVMFPMRRTDQQIYEYACHEGNERSMVGTLKTARYEEAEAHSPK
jgi:hypothetical protein